MKKLLLLIAILGLMVPLQARKKAPKMEILNDEGFKSSSYSKLILGKVSAEKFLRKIENLKNFDAVANQIDDINASLKDELDKYARREFIPGKGKKKLRVSAVMTDFNAGSTAAAVMVGYGAGNGKCSYEIQFWEGDREVASFATTQRIARIKHGGWGPQDVTGSQSRNEIPKLVVDLVDKFLAEH